MTKISIDTITHRRVLAVALPIVLSNATGPILGLVDTGVVGQLGQAAPIVAVGLGATILTVTYWMFGFLRMATAGLVAQAQGRGDHGEVVVLLMRALAIAAAAGVALILLQRPIFTSGLFVAASSPEAEEMAHSYMSIRIWSAPAAIALFGITGWLIALERTKGVLIIQLVMNGTNILLDLVFVMGFGWGVQGVAIATFIAEWSGLLLGLWLCRTAFADPIWRAWETVFDRARILAFATLGRDILIRSFLLEVIFVSFVLIGSSFGDVPLAANHILLQFLHVTAYAMDGFAFAAEALVGQAFGARNSSALRKAANFAFIWGTISGLVFAIVFALFGGFIIDFLTTAPDVRIEARSYLLFMVLAPVAGVAAWMFDGVFIGAMRARDMRNMMVISTLCYGMAVILLIPVYGNTGLWIALLISFVVRGVSLWFKYPGLIRASESGS